MEEYDDELYKTNNEGFDGRVNKNCIQLSIPFNDLGRILIKKMMIVRKVSDQNNAISNFDSKSNTVTIWII